MANLTKIEALIIDDEAPARSIIKEFLKNNPEVESIGECSNGFEAIKLIKEKEPRLIFLDIQMPKVNGLELLEILDNPPEVIFTTAYDEYAIKAFELNAVDYLLKPFSEQRFNEAVTKATTKIKKEGFHTPIAPQKIREDIGEELTRIVVKKGIGMTVIGLNDILFIEAQEDYIMIHTEVGRFMKNQTMHYYEHHLPENEFIRIHRSYIANINKINKLEPYDKDTYLAVISPKHKLRISRTGYKKLKNKLKF